MVTLKNLFQTFGHDPRWSRLAAASIAPMTAVFFRKLGNQDITTITDFDIQLQLAVSDQPDERKAKAQSCINHLRQWAAEHGHPFAQPEPEPEPEPPNQGDRSRDSLRMSDHGPVPLIGPKPKAEKPKAQPKPKKEKPRNDYRPELADSVQDYADRNDLNIYNSPQRGKPSTGTIYYDDSSRGYSKSGKKVYHSCWRAEIIINGQRYRHREKWREECEKWLKAVKQGKIKPTDNKADWWRMEQHKDEKVRITEQIASAAEEACLVYEYNQTGSTEHVFEYCEKALLPHLVYYCARVLKLGEEKSISGACQAVGLILTKIVAGRPVTNITFTCKRMLRIYASRGDFWYYDRAPEQVRLMVNRINLSPLEELYKVSRDRRI